MSAARELSLVTLTDALEGLVTRPFDSQDPRHVALLELLSDGCPECEAALRRARREQVERRQSWLD